MEPGTGTRISDGKVVPVESTKVQGQYSPEIKVASPDKGLEQYWIKYLKPESV